LPTDGRAERIELGVLVGKDLLVVGMDLNVVEIGGLDGIAIAGGGVDGVVAVGEKGVVGPIW